MNKETFMQFLRDRGFPEESIEYETAHIASIGGAYALEKFMNLVKIIEEDTRNG